MCRNIKFFYKIFSMEDNSQIEYIYFIVNVKLFKKIISSILSTKEVALLGSNCMTEYFRKYKQVLTICMLYLHDSLMKLISNN